MLHYKMIANLLEIQPLLGYCYGANNKKRFILIMKFSGILTLISGTVLSAIYIVFSRPVVTLFINDTQTISDYLAIVISLLLLWRSFTKIQGRPVLKIYLIFQKGDSKPPPFKKTIVSLILSSLMLPVIPGKNSPQVQQPLHSAIVEYLMSF